MRGYLNIELLSDACFSMPAAFDVTVNTDVALDRFGLPTISGKTLHGLLRDTWLSLPADPDTDRVGKVLLGEGPSDHRGVGNLRIGDALVDNGTRQWARWARERKIPDPVKSAYLRDAFLDRRTVTKIDRNDDAPETETLRVMRVAPRGLTMRAPLSAVGTITQPEQDLLLLLTACTRHIGLARNRGLGHVKLTIDWIDDDAPKATAPSSTSGNQATAFLPIKMRLTAPCLISGDDADPNSRSTKPYITGAAVRGAVASVALRTGVPDALFEEIIASGVVRFSNAYPAVDGKRSLPSPITWQRRKDPRLHDASPDAHARDTALFLAGLEALDENPNQYQPMENHFFAPIAGRQRPAAAATRQTIHQERDRATGVPKADVTNVFAYEALEEGQLFIGALAVPADRPALVTCLADILAQPLWLGRSARSGYGGAPEVEMGAPAKTEPGADLRNVGAGDGFTVRLTSDAILRDSDTGQHNPWRLGDVIEKRFVGRAVVAKAFVRYTVCTGYNHLWRSSLPAVRAAAAGSVVLLEALHDMSANDLSALTADPVGERAADGFGCITVEIDSFRGLSIEPARVEIPGVPSTPATGAVMNAQRRLSERRLRVILAQAAIEAAGTHQSLPTPSLIQRLRGPLRSPDTWRETYSKWTSGPQETQLKALAREKLMESSAKIRFLNHGAPNHRRLTLWDILRLAANPEWVPVSLFDAAERQACQIVADETAADIWAEKRAALAHYYLDVLFRCLAREAQANGGS